MLGYLGFLSLVKSLQKIHYKRRSCRMCSRIDPCGNESHPSQLLGIKNQVSKIMQIHQNRKLKQQLQSGEEIRVA